MKFTDNHSHDVQIVKAADIYFKSVSVMIMRFSVILSPDW